MRFNKTLRTVGIVLSLAALLFLAGCGGGDDDNGNGKPKRPKNPKSGAEKFPADDATGVVKGVVMLEGDVPDGEQIVMTGDDVCEEHHGDPFVESVQVTDGKIKNVLVWIESEDLDGYNYEDHASIKREVVVDQKGCLYKPHVFGVMIGQAWKVTSSDPTDHNVKFVTDRNNSFNETIKKGGSLNMNEKAGIENTEFAKLACDVHGWMGAHAGIFNHPFFAVTDENGAFELPALPPGEYTLKAWWEPHKTGDNATEVEMTITVAEGDNEVTVKIGG